jgi:inorganic pyrophosphatase
MAVPRSGRVLVHRDRMCNTLFPVFQPSSRGQAMQKTNSLQEAVSFPVQAYRRPKDIRALRTENVSFAGSPRKHPYAPDKIVLVADPYSANTFYFEFEKSDIAFAEELPSIADMDGNTLTMARIWVKKGSLAMRCTPFLAGDTRLTSE